MTNPVSNALKSMNMSPNPSWVKFSPMSSMDMAPAPACVRTLTEPYPRSQRNDGIAEGVSVCYDSGSSSR